MLQKNTKKVQVKFFFYPSFLLQTFTIHRREQEGGYFFNLSLPFLCALQILH